MSESLINACNALDAFAQVVLNTIQDDRPFQEIWGLWNCPPLTRHDLSDIPIKLSARLRELSPKQIDPELDAKLATIPNRLQLIQAHTLPQLPGGNAGAAMTVILDSMEWINSFASPYLPPIIDWNDVEEQKLMPRALTRRLRSVDTQITNLEAKSGDLDEAVKSITDAHATAEALPTDLASLEEAKQVVVKAGKAADEASMNAQSAYDKAFLIMANIGVLEQEAKKLVENCEDAFSAATTKGLGEAFSKRATSLAFSMWIWVAGLLIALIIAAFLSHNRLSLLQRLIETKEPNVGLLWINFILAFFSIAAPAWFAWLATKQIGQRFRLAEDYAFKASVAQAYAGYNKEAARIDPAFAARLFGLALDRIDEAPLRFIESENHGSPFHEFFKEWFRTNSKSVNIPKNIDSNRAAQHPE
jgi:23S rRNA maturation mini-RNase III